MYQVIRLAALVMLAALVLRTPRQAAAQGLQPWAVEMRVPTAPTVATGAGAWFLAYELHVTNFSASPLTLRRIEVLGAGEDGRVLLALEDSALARALTRPGVSPAPALMERTQIGGGLRAVAFLWIPAADGDTPPVQLRHRLTLARGNSDSATAQVVDGAVVPVTADVAIIGPPLRGDGWIAANGPTALSGHRRALIAAAGTPTIAQRFAIDYVQMDSAGRRWVGDSLVNASYHAQGADAIAVADGVVAATKDGIPENVPGVSSRAVPITLETIGGNYVMLDIGGGRYAFYAHLQPGSLRVREGDRVRRGHVLGLVGNSGNSTEPHLHFHLSDGTSPLGAEGIPYAHETFELVGRCRGFAECARTAPETRRQEMPMGGEIVRFPE